MSPDNTATYEDTLTESIPPCELPPEGWRCTLDAGHDGPCPTVEISVYDGMSTRDLLILLHERFDKVETIAENVQEQFAPILEKIGNNPMLKMLLK